MRGIFKKLGRRIENWSRTKPLIFDAHPDKGAGLSSFVTY